MREFCDWCKNKSRATYSANRFSLAPTSYPGRSLRFLPCRRDDLSDDQGGNGERAWVRGCACACFSSIGVASVETARALNTHIWLVRASKYTGIFDGRAIVK